MADKYSVIYDPVDRSPFAMLRDLNGEIVAYSVQASANQWAIEYNGGRKQIPYGMLSTDFIEMDSAFSDSFKSANGRQGRVSRRAEMLLQATNQHEQVAIVYGVKSAKNSKRKNGTSRMVMPVIGHLQKEVFRTKVINEAIRTGKRWPRKNNAV